MIKTIRIVDFQWVEGDRCEVSIHVINPSSYELRITNMQLLTEDVEFESESTSVILPPSVDQKTTPTVITLSGNACFFGCTAVVFLFFMLNHILFRHTTQTWTSKNCWLFDDCAWFEEPL